MLWVKRSGRSRSLKTAPLEPQSKNDGFLTTLHPEGSFNNIRHDIERRRKVIRPEINYRNVAINVAIPLLVCFVICFWSVGYALVLLGLYFFLRFRAVLIFLIRLYQRYASEDMRAACLFEPSCSEYMRMALIKYGVIRGVIKGINRLLRCHYPNGGEDYP